MAFLADRTARIFDAALATMSAKALVAEACGSRLQGFATLSRDEMRVAGYGEETTAIDVCASSPLP